jgi:hypothetical protein
LVAKGQLLSGRRLNSVSECCQDATTAAHTVADRLLIAGSCYQESGPAMAPFVLDRDSRLQPTHLDER